MSDSLALLSLGSGVVDPVMRLFWGGCLFVSDFLTIFLRGSGMEELGTDNGANGLPVRSLSLFEK